MEKSKAFVIDSNFWILSYVDFMTVIMAFFISFTLIATKVATATELFIVKKIDKIEKQLSHYLEKSGFQVENVGYNGVRVIIPSEVKSKKMFRPRSANIEEEFKTYLDIMTTIIADSSEFVEILSRYKAKFQSNNQKLDISMRVEGHTDSEDDDDYNMKLSLRRAENVKNYIYSQKKFPDNIYAIAGYGESRPLNDIKNKDENRRVEIYLNITLEDIEVYGCTDNTAVNYNPKANHKDDSCEYAQPKA